MKNKTTTQKTSTFNNIIEAVLMSGKTCKDIQDMLKLLMDMREYHHMREKTKQIDDQINWQKGWLDCMDKMKHVL